MRLSMLPVSVAIHAAVLVTFLLMPIGAAGDLPTPWPLGRPSYVEAAAAPPPLPVERSASSRPRPASVPTRAPDSIADPVETAEAPVADGGLPSFGDAAAGVPPGLGEVGAVAPPPPPPPPAERPAIVRAGGTIREPRKIVHMPVVYPEVARQARIEGRVLLEATIDERGVITDLRVLRSQPLLDGAAIAAVRQWRYTPTLLNGVPVRVLLTITVNFTLGDRVP